MTKQVLKTCGKDVQSARQSFRPGGHVDPRQEFTRLDVETRQAHARAVGSLVPIEQDQHGRRSPVTRSHRQVIFNKATEILCEFLPDEHLLNIRRHNGQPLLDEQPL